jgi:hypothetical protein
MPLPFRTVASSYGQDRPLVTAPRAEKLAL